MTSHRNPAIDNELARQQKLHEEIARGIEEREREQYEIAERRHRTTLRWIKTGVAVSTLAALLSGLVIWMQAW